MNSSDAEAVTSQSFCKNQYPISKLKERIIEHHQELVKKLGRAVSW